MTRTIETAPPKSKKGLIEYLRGLGAGTEIVVSLEVLCNSRPEANQKLERSAATIHKAQTNALALRILDLSPNLKPQPFWFSLEDDKALNAEYEFTESFWKRSTCAYKGTADERRTVLTFHY